eukprot:CAMPEP_0194198018 /NCGR_PEP_ID=MMETSP0154-20130528/77531_1 /TAXON_ID=1049557 /ORGANISM="Thalassiothrix antarctica, Strain L6-D1" /LENGTH=31 /DNA_ID= /DNA_START= /DNA_END= /DNA_ORIENTATION=
MALWLDSELVVAMALYLVLELELELDQAMEL